MCAIKLHPAKNSSAAIVITALYCAPKQTKEPTLAKLDSISDEIIDERTGDVLSHRYLGDFNTSSWGTLFEEWCLEIGAWQLNDPPTSTINTGGVLVHAAL